MAVFALAVYIYLSLLYVIDSVNVTWKLSPDTMPRAYSSMAYGQNSSLIYLLGGLESNMEWSRNEFVFNPSTGNFTLLFRDLSPELFDCSAQCSAEFPSLSSEKDFRIFIMGPIQQKSTDTNGWIYYAINETYDEATFDYFPDKAQWPCSVADNKHFHNSPIIYLIGGIQNDDGHTFGVADLLGYNLTSDSNGSGWIQGLSKMDQPRYAGSCILANDYIYYFGGDNGKETLNTIIKYDIINNKWETLNTTLRQKRTGHRNVYVENKNAILIIGGIGDSYMDKLSSVEYFDVNSDQIISSAESNMNFERDEVGAIAWKDGRIFVFGGIYNSTYVHDTYEIGVIQ